MYSVRYFAALSINFLFSRQFSYVSNIKFREIPYNRSRADTWGQTVGRAGTAKLTGTFCYVRERT